MKVHKVDHTQSIGFKVGTQLLIKKHAAFNLRRICSTWFFQFI